ncbi:hypothetical protein DB31_1029 [Hyalangium minutum]|uniref:Uncharacterized protein n=1 Tax=Hyalangium minutum TaxID=394096 RepID=A0A085WFU3_9BACT|nr:hypothetical protein DB31_1029 [Hyalangium minutum]
MHVSLLVVNPSEGVLPGPAADPHPGMDAAWNSCPEGYPRLGE